MTWPLVSVITPTWRRRDLLLRRCIPSVAAQTYPAVEHVIVSDGPDWDLGEPILEASNPRHQVTFTCLPEHDTAGHWGGPARRRGLDIAHGKLIAYLDDDDAYRPDHLQVLAAALADCPAARFAVSRMVSHSPAGDTTVIGTGPPAYGAIGTPMILHHADLADVATWGPPSPAEDWELVSAWLNARTGFVAVPDETIDVWP